MSHARSTRRFLTAAVAGGLAAATFLLGMPTAVADDATVSGMVETTSGTPLGSVQVGWLPTGDAGLPSEIPLNTTLATTDASGAFSFTVPTGSGDGWIWVGAANGQVTEAQAATTTVEVAPAVVGAAGVDVTGRSVVWAQAAPLSESDLQAGKAAGITVPVQLAGTVQGQAANLKNAQVQLLNDAGDEVDATTASPTGAYTLDGEIPGKYQIVVSSGDGYAPTAPQPVTVSAGGTTNSTPTRAKAATVAGTVTVGGKKTAGIPVELDAAHDPDVGDASTSKTGAYAIQNLSTGTYTAQFGTYSTFTPGPALPVTKTVHVTKLGSTVRVDAALAAAAAVSGSVTVAKGDSITVYAENAAGTFLESTTVSRSGGFTVRGLPSGRLTIVALDTKKHTVATKPVTTTGGRTASVGTLSFSGRALSATVTVPGVTSGTDVDLSDASGFWFYETDATTNSAGVVTFGDLVPGRYTFTVDADSHKTSTTTRSITKSSRFTLAPGAADVPGALALTATVQGIRWTNGLTVSSADGETFDVGPWSAQSLESGTYTLEPDAGQLVGPYWLAVPQGTVQITSGVTTTLTEALTVAGG